MNESKLIETRTYLIIETLDGKPLYAGMKLNIRGTPNSHYHTITRVDDNTGVSYSTYIRPSRGWARKIRVLKAKRGLDKHK